MAHVGTVGQVVGAELAHEKLVEEGGFVARPTGRVEDGFVWSGAGVEVLGHEFERFVPTDGAVVGGIGIQYHRFSEATCVVEVEVGKVRQFLNGVSGKELPVGAFLGDFSGDGLGAIFAKFETRSFAIGIGPGAAGAIEATFLVSPQ